MRLDALTDTPRHKILVARDMPAWWPGVGDSNAARCTVFQTRQYLDAWSASFGQTGDYAPCFVSVFGTDAQPLLLLPLAIERRWGTRVLSFIDQGQCDYNAPVLFAPEVAWTKAEAAAMWRQVLAALPPVDVVQFAKMPETVQGLRNPLQLLALDPEEVSAHGNRLDLPWPEVESHLYSPKEIRKKERGLARLGETRLVTAEDAGMRGTLLDALVVQKQRRYVETKVPGFSESPAALAFLRQASSIFATSGHLLLSALMVGEEIAAIQWGLVHDRTFYALITSYADGLLAQYSCGRVLNYRLVKLLHERDFRYFDQGFGDEAYKLRNTDTRVPLYRADIAVTLRGRLYLSAQAGLHRLRNSRLGTALRSLKWTVRQRLGLRTLPEPGGGS